MRTGITPLIIGSRHCPWIHPNSWSFTVTPLQTDSDIPRREHHSIQKGKSGNPSVLQSMMVQTASGEIKIYLEFRRGRLEKKRGFSSILEPTSRKTVRFTRSSSSREPPKHPDFLSLEIIPCISCTNLSCYNFPVMSSEPVPPNHRPSGSSLQWW
jgi:hypothetical protein